MSPTDSKNETKSGPGAVPEAQKHPCRTKVTTKRSRETPRTTRASQRQPKVGQRHAKPTPETPKGIQKRTKRPPKSHNKTRKNVKIRHHQKMFFQLFRKTQKTQNSRSTSPKLSSHASETAVSKMTPKNMSTIKAKM